MMWTFAKQSTRPQNGDFFVSYNVSKIRHVGHVKLQRAYGSFTLHTLRNVAVATTCFVLDGPILPINRYLIAAMKQLKSAFL